MVNILPKTQKKYQLKIPSQSDNLALIRELIAKVASQVGFDDDEANKIELAVDEACTNVIKHAYNQNANQVLDVLVKTDAKKIIVIVSDKGQGFNPDRVRTPDLNKSIKEGRKGGLGICLMKTLMDKVDFQIKPGQKNQVTMIKYIN